MSDYKTLQQRREYIDNLNQNRCGMSDLERATELDRAATVAWEKAESRLDHWEAVGDVLLARKAAATAASARLRLLETREKVVVAMLEERIKLRQNRSKYEHMEF